jgi:hypothetical protein
MTKLDFRFLFLSLVAFLSLGGLFLWLGFNCFTEETGEEMRLKPFLTLCYKENCFSAIKAETEKEKRQGLMNQPGLAKDYAFFLFFQNRFRAVFG